MFNSLLTIGSGSLIIPAMIPEVRDPVFVFALVLLIILVAPFALARARLPGLLGLIVAGMVVGPHGLGVLARDRTFELLGSVGLIYLMFLAGLEIELQQFVRDKKHSLVFGGLTFFIPQVLGALGARFLLGMSWATAILLASMFASHTLITYGIVKRFGIARNRAVTAGIGGTILTDTAALLVLALVVEYVDGSLSGWFWARQLLLLVICVVAILFGLPRLARWFFRHMAISGEVEFIFVLAAVFISGAVAKLAGMEPIIGAFLAGLALGRFTPEHGALRNRVEFVGHALFIPFFLLSVGMLVDLRVLIGGAAAWQVMAYMVLGVIAFKWLAAEGTGRLLGFTAAERGVLFGMSVNQAAATLAAVLVGYRIGLFDDFVLSGTIMMILASCVVGALATEKHAPEVADGEVESARPIARDFGERILIGLGNPESVSSLMDMALLLRLQESHHPLFPVAVVSDAGDVDQAIGRAERLLGGAVKQSLGAGVPASPFARVDFSIATGLMHLASECRATFVLLGWAGRVAAWNRIFRRTVHELLMQTHAVIGVYKSAAPINSVEVVRVLVPPFLEKHAGFQPVVLLLRRIAQRLQARLVFACDEGRLESLRSSIGDPPRELKESCEGIASWQQAAAWAAERLTPQELAVVLGVRSGRRAWQPALDRLPMLLSERAPSCNLLVLYPVSDENDEDVRPVAESQTESASALLRSDRFFPGLDDMSVESAVGTMVRAALPQHPSVADRLARQLADVAKQYPVEFAPGVLLLHSHAGEWGEALVMAGVSRKGIAVPGLESPVKLLLLVVADRHQRNEEYLRVLADISRVLQRPGIIARLMDISSPVELDRVLADTEQTDRDSPV
ncbi:MAG: Glutathione-regulated potassium-efflux system protein KefC [Verrucomicrobia bacterium ADurb.Bin345]|nr:MAG: Glutathione-regulated potassium-efflux system protein KefC [Verrucomicrobia bacterium ADurb.Bin345]